jgi:light-regulated signal transduction histidine kinase (bacteriophytochrome)
LYNSGKVLSNYFNMFWECAVTTYESAEALAAAIEQCAREPIQAPGSIQPHGFMLVLDPLTFTVLQASANTETWLGVSAEALVGQGLASLLAVPGMLAQRLATLPPSDPHPFYVGDLVFEAPEGLRTYAMLAHHWDSVLIAEFEPASDSAAAYGQLYPLVRAFVVELHDIQTVDKLCERVVVEVKRITGFGRVMAYTFDAEGNGIVLAQAADDGYPSYLGMRFPASDVPAQARALYCANRIRVIENADYQAAPLVPGSNPLTGKPLDLSYSALRSVSPVHLQYMRNMGTPASMSISIVVRGKLWGLVSCHHASPRTVGYQVRTACELLGSVVSLQIEAREAHADTHKRLGLRQQVVEMLSAMADRDSVTEGLLALPEVFLGFAAASGAAIVSEGRCEILGAAPPQRVVEALVQWLGREGADDLFHSNNTGRDVPVRCGIAEHVAGVLAIAISKVHNHYLLWFRPEHAHTVNWAGRPDKTVGPEGKLSPRHSFEQWQEAVRGYAMPWDPLEVDAVVELRTAVLGIVLRKAEEMALLAGELKKSNKELEAFSYSVSHDLRAPLRHIAGYAELLTDFDGDKLSDRGMRFLEHIGESARFAGTLVDNLLSFSQMGRAALRHSDVNLEALVHAIQAEMAPDYEGRNVVWRVGPMPAVVGDPAFLHLVLRNLVSNALKYSRDRDPAVIEIGSPAPQGTGETVVFVKDNGVGFDMAYAGKLFGVFQRLHRMEEFEGTGIGLASVRRIIERHHGRVWAEGAPGEGAAFYFALPNQQ